MSIDGGATVTILELTGYKALHTSWSPDDTIIYVRDRALWRMSADGGEPESLTSPSAAGPQWPEILPGGDAVLFAVSRNLKQRFEREAKAISSLNHPHICTIHGKDHHGALAMAR